MSNYLAGSGSFWESDFQDKDLLETFGEAATEALQSLYMDVANATMDIGLPSIPPHERFKWDILTIKKKKSQSSEIIKSYTIPHAKKSRGFRFSDVLTSSHLNPKVIYVFERDYSIDENKITFTADPFKDVGASYKEEGLFYVMNLWSPIADVDTNRIWRQYGHFTNLWGYSSEEYKRFVSGMFYARMLGPSVNRLETAIQLMAGIPVASDIVETVIAVSKSYENSTIKTSANEYSIGEGAIITVKAGDVLRPFQTLTDSVKVVDYINGGDWWSGYIHKIPAKLGVVTNINDAFNTYLKYHTFKVDISYIPFLKSIAQAKEKSALYETKPINRRRHLSELKLNRTMRLGEIVSLGAIGYVSTKKLMAFITQFKPANTYAFVVYRYELSHSIPHHGSSFEFGIQQTVLSQEIAIESEDMLDIGVQVAVDMNNIRSVFSSHRISLDSQGSQLCFLDNALFYETTSGFFKEEVPIGTVNGVNDTFALSGIPEINSLELYQDKLLLIPDVDYVLSDVDVIFTTPPTISNFRALYRMPADTATQFYDYVSVAGVTDNINQDFTIEDNEIDDISLRVFINRKCLTWQTDYTYGDGLVRLAIAPEPGDVIFVFYRKNTQIPFVDNYPIVGIVDGENQTFSLFARYDEWMRLYIDNEFQTFGIDYLISNTDVIFTTPPTVRPVAHYVATV